MVGGKRTLNRGTKSRSKKTGNRKRGAVLKLSKPMRAAVARVFKGELETKYVTADVVSQRALTWDLTGATVNSHMYNVLPAIQQGDGSNQRVGDRISPVRMVVHNEYYIDEAFAAQYSTYVRQIVATNKTYRSSFSWIPAVWAAEQPKMLDNGDGTTTAPTGDTNVDPVNLMKPCYKTDWTFHKGSTRFTLGKNGGQLYSTVPQIIQPYGAFAFDKTISTTIATPKYLKYDEGSTYPDGFLPLVGAYMGNVGNQVISAAAPAGLGPYTVPNKLPTTPFIYWNCRVELWFKDA